MTLHTGLDATLCYAGDVARGGGGVGVGGGPVLVFSCFKRILVQVLDTEFPIYKRFQTLFSIVFCSGFATPLKLAC